MKKSNLLKSLLGLSFLAATAVQADHNSIWGEGWANMPNDIHDSVNRFLDDDVTSGSGSSATTTTRGGSQATSRGGRS